VKRAKTDPFVAGFSLVEAPAADALTATIVAARSTVAAQLLPNWDRGFIGLQRTVIRDAADRALAASTAVRLKNTAPGVPRLDAQASAAAAGPASANSTSGAAGPEVRQ